ncbi:MAG: hypothetical protein ACRD4O_16150 [Bryobacteraceae bacterium]
MAEGNGSGRLDRIEANLERASERINALTDRFHEMADSHEHDFKQLMTWQVLMQDKVERIAATQQAEQKRLNTLSENTDKRVAELVSAIGKLIERL